MVPAVSDIRKILLVTNDFGPRSGGIETFILGLLEKLDGSQISIYTSAQPGDGEFDEELARKFKLAIYRDKSKILLPSPRVIREVKRVMKLHGSQIVWFGSAAPLGLMATNLRKAGARRIVGLTHGHEVWWAKLFPFNLAIRKIGNSFDALTFLGSFTKDAMKSAIGKRAELIQVAPGISTSLFKPGQKPAALMAKYQIEDRPTLICVGRLVHRKGQDKLIAAMPKIKEAIPNAQLLFVGSGPRAEYLQRAITKLDLAEDIKLLGRVKYEELPAHFLLGDVFVMPSRSRLFGLEVEGLGIVYLEASASGLPVIAGDSGGAPDAVIPNKTGLLVDGRDTESIATACIKLLSNPTLAKEFGKNGRQWTVSTWSWDIWGEKFAKVLEG
ncbi:MAG: glycosyltransferase family 4 protein [Actinomycetota bacterium]|jgi:phosphatidyl-myo-inositol dimannoside synthase|tara:strand:- start:1245 stop:2399 length:1155 start_codon:yes stop_codon:yes gene_type:complete